MIQWPNQNIHPSAHAHEYRSDNCGVNVKPLSEGQNVKPEEKYSVKFTRDSHAPNK